MGRELRRVPLDFDWPLNRTWEGYIHPRYRPCPSDNCENGYTIAGKWIECLAHLLLMVGEAGVTPQKPLHPWLVGIPLAPERRPHADAAEFSTGLAGRSMSPFGHDAMDRWHATEALVKAAGLPEDWHICSVCKGHTIHPDDLEASEKWQPTEPPTGEGYQMWETTSEGSPITPVFATLDELATYAAAHCTTFGSNRASAEEWKAMLADDLVVHRDAHGNIFM